AKGLVDKALEAEKHGLWGRAYFDQRGITEGEYKLGDDFMRLGAEVTRKLGWETIVDDKEATFPVAMPLSQVAIYAGWYDAEASGPFTQSSVEFMPGAFAYHLHSFSAATIRSPNKHWVGPLLAKGATITVGFVDEPYLGGTLDVGVFLSRFLRGFSFGEAAYASQTALSWQTTVIGDPLYRPVDRGPQQLHERLVAQESKLLEWSHLGVVNLNLVQGYPVEEVIGYINELGTNSPVLMEKLGDLLTQQSKTWPAINAYAQALNLQPSPQQELRLLLTLGERLSNAGRREEALGMYRLIGKKLPNYPGLNEVNQRIAALSGEGESKTVPESRRP
ncbi:MAG: TIGR03790 family protein, partial [Limisphaerales bacterium]